jgi:hypothetical protein
MEQERGNGWSRGVHPDDLETCFATYCEAFDAREPFWMKYRLRRSDGGYGLIVDQGMPLVTPRGVFAGYVGSAIEITGSNSASAGVA